jgi:hypothetical protein
MAATMPNQNLLAVLCTCIASVLYYACFRLEQVVVERALEARQLEMLQALPPIFPIAAFFVTLFSVFILPALLIALGSAVPAHKFSAFRLQQRLALTRGYCYVSKVRTSELLLQVKALGRYPRLSHATARLGSFTLASLLPQHMLLVPGKRGIRLGALSDILSSPLATALLSPELSACLNRYRDVFRQPFAIPRHLHQHAASCGIDPNPHGRPHPHGLHYALQRKFESIVHGFVKGKQYSLLSRKPSSYTPLVQDATSMANAILVGKDLTRYPNGFCAAPVVNEPLAVLSDTLHMLSTADIDALFERSPNLEMLFASAVIAPEAKAGTPDEYPEVYTLTRTHGGWNYCPEGHVNGSYFQPDHAVEWLDCHSIEGENRTLHVTQLETYLAHHLFVITRSAVLSPESRTFARGNWISVPATLMPLTPASERRARAPLVSKMASFAERYPGTELPDYHAKVSQVHAASADDASYAEKVAAAVLSHRLRSTRSPALRTVVDMVNIVFAIVINIPFNPSLSISLILGRSQPMSFAPQPFYTFPTRSYDTRTSHVSSWTSREVLEPVNLFGRAGHTLLGCWALVNFALGGWIVPKVVVTHLLERFFQIITWQDFIHVFSRTWEAVEATPSRVAIVLFMAWLGSLGLFTLPFTFYYVLTDVHRVVQHRLARAMNMERYHEYSLYHAVAAVFGVGNQHLFGVPGYSYLWQAFLSWYCFATAFPGLVHNFYWRPGNVLHTLADFWNGKLLFCTPQPDFWRVCEPAIPRFIVCCLVFGFFFRLLAPRFNVATDYRVYLNTIPWLYTRIINFSASAVVLRAPSLPGHWLIDWCFSRILLGALLFGTAVAFMLVPLVMAPLVGFAVMFVFFLRFWGSNFTPRSTPLLLPLHNPNFAGLASYGTIALPPAAAPPAAAVPPPFIPAAVIPPHVAPPTTAPHAGLYFQPAMRQIGTAPGHLQHPYSPWLLNTQDMDYQSICMRVAAMPPTMNNLDPNYSCFWQCLSTVYGLPAEKMAACFLASLHTGDIIPTNHMGLVTPAQMTLAARLFHVTMTIQHRGAAAAMPLNYFNATVGMPGFPALNLAVGIVQTQTIDAAGNAVSVYHVSNFQPAAPAPPGPVPPLPAAPGPVAGLVGYSSPRLSPAFFVYALCAFPVKFGRFYTQLLNPATISDAAAHYLQARPHALPGGRHVFNPLPAQGLTPTTFNYRTQRPVAIALATDLRSNRSLWLTSDSDFKLPSQLVGSCKVAETRDVTTTLFLGVPGCGKTTAAKAFFQANGIDRREVTWVFPSSFVGSDSLSNGPNRSPLGPDAVSSQYCDGFEIFRKPPMSTLVLDDFTRFPPGTIDLLLLTYPHISHLILTGDPSQSHTAFPTPNTQTRAYGTLCSQVMAQCPNASYATISHRLAPSVADVLGIHTTSTAAGDILVTSQPPEGVPLFVTSPRFAETKTGGGADAFVTSTSQGVDVSGDICLDLGGMSSTMLNGAFLVGITRGQGNVFLSIDAAATPPAVGSFSCGSILTSIATVSGFRRVSLLTAQSDPDRLIARSVTEHIRRCVPSLRANVPVIPLVGFTPDAVPSLLGQPVSPAAIQQGLGFHFPAFSNFRHVPSRPTASGTVPAAVSIVDPALEFAQPEARDALDSEVAFNGTLTNQFKARKHPGVKTHHTRDAATFGISAKKRIFKASETANRASYDSSFNDRKFKQLKAGFCSIFPRFLQKRSFSELMDKCAEDVFDSWTAKRTLRAMQKKISKEAVDWSPQQTLLFLKSQEVKKKEKWFSVACPGQIVTEFPMQKTFRDAVFALCIERVVLAECPSHIYLHLRRSTSDLKAWSADHLTGVNQFVETDYTAWDSSIDGSFIRFDAWLLAQVGAPQAYIDCYVAEACATRCFKGNMRLMQHSGNRYTFLFNTLRNLALTQHSYSNIRDNAQAFGGDDSLIAGPAHVSPNFNPRYWLMNPKVVVSSTGHLFGHLITDGVLSYDYEYMNNRLEVGIVNNREADFFRSFCDQMAALPAPEDPHYALTLNRLLQHCGAKGFVFAALQHLRPSGPVMYPQSIWSNGILPEAKWPIMWCD